MKYKTLVIIPLLMVGLAYVAMKAYVYYKITDGIEKIIRVTAPFAQLTYGGIGSSLTGSINLDRVAITPTGSYDEVTIRRLVISGDGPLFLLELAQGFDKGRTPEQMFVAVQQLESPVASSFLSSLSNNLGRDKSVPIQQKIDPCSLAGILTSAGLKELGFPSLTINAKMGYRYDQTTEEIQFDLVYELAGVESSSISLKLHGLTTAAIIGDGDMPIFDELHLVHMVQPGYMKQMVTMCAANAAQSPDLFIDSLFTQPDKYYLTTLGFIPGPGLTAMLKQLLTNAGELDIWAIPSSGINPSTLSAYRADDLVNLLGVTVSYNNKPVTDLSFSLESSREKPKAASSSTSSLKQAPEADATTARPQPALRYIDTPISDLPKYIGYRVRIYTLDNDIPKQGLLISINYDKVNVEHLLYNGKMTAHLHKDRIARLEVLRRE